MASSSGSTNLQSSKDSLEDCMCTICLCILIQPVTLPCGHELCMPCFKQTMEEASLSCPLCRVRISSWARKAAKAKTLVDQKRWEQIQRLFPGKVQKRLDGLDDDTDEELEEKEEIDGSYRRMIQLSNPGEIRQEYEAEIKRLELERQKEEEASVALIQHLCSHEEEESQAVRLQQEEIVAHDAELAQKLGSVISEVDTDIPINRLFQRSRDNYPSQLLHRSVSSTPSHCSPDSSVKGKQTVTKNNKTLETFFRRLPVGTAVKCSSELRSTTSELVTVKYGQNLTNSVPVRSESVSLRDKENLLDIIPEKPCDNIQFYEDIDIGEAYSRNCVNNEEIKIGETYTKDPVTVSSNSSITIHSDSSESVLTCEKRKSSGIKSNENDVSNIKPIQLCTKAPNKSKPKIGPIEPCVHLTPRILFSTDCFSEASFPVKNLCSNSSANHPAEQNKTHMGSFKSKLWGGGSSENMEYKNTLGTDFLDKHPSRRARSESPPVLRVLPSSRHVFYDDSQRRAYSRSTLDDFRLRAGHTTLLKDSHLVNPFPRDVQNNKSSSKMDCLLEAQSTKQKIVYECERQDYGIDKPLSNLDRNDRVNGTLQYISLGRSENDCKSASEIIADSREESSFRNKTRSLSSKEALTSDYQSLLFEAKSSGQSLSPSCVDTDAQSVSLQEFKITPSTSSSMPYFSARPSGIFNPATVPQWTEALYTDKGKGKRLMKKSGNRNSPKSTGNTTNMQEKEDDCVLEQDCLTGDRKECEDDESAMKLKELVHEYRAGKYKTSSRSHRGRTNSAKTKTRSVSEVPILLDKNRTNNQKKFPLKTTSDDKTSTKLVAKYASSVDQHSSTENHTKNSSIHDIIVAKCSKSSESSRKHTMNRESQKLIKDWFSPRETGYKPHSAKNKDVSNKSSQVQRKTKVAIKKSNVVSDTESDASDLPSTSSSAASTPDKLNVRTSNRVKKVNSKLDQFHLTNNYQWLTTSPSKTNLDSPRKSPAKLHKRKHVDNTSKISPSKQRKLMSSKTSEKKSEFEWHNGDFLSSEKEEDLSQEERDLRLAMRLQQQFELADKFNLNILRFKGTDDQYSLRGQK